MSVGSRIKELRESKKMSRTELAYRINVTVGAISNYENGVSFPKEPILFKIIEALECDANYLFQDSIKMSSITNDVSISEYNFIKKFRTLDKYSQKLINIIMDNEYKRHLDYAIFLNNENSPDAILESSSRDDIGNIKRQTYYMRELNAAHERTDIKVTDEMRKLDDDIMNDENF